MEVFSEFIYRFKYNQMQKKNSSRLLKNTHWQAHSKMYIEMQRAQINQRKIFLKKKKVGGLMLPDYKIYNNLY